MNAIRPVFLSRVIRGSARAWAVALVMLCASTGWGQSPVRIWTDVEGRQVEAALRGFDSGDLILTLKDGRAARLSMGRLSEDDQFYAASHAADLVSVPAAPPGGTTATSAPLQIMRGEWLKRVTVPMNLTRVRTVEEIPAAKKYVYETAAFRMTANTPLSLQASTAVALIFESARELLRLSPWGLRAQPPDGRFKAELFETMEQYHARGAPANTAGVYFRNERVFAVPYKSLGLALKNGVYVKDEGFQIKTLMHELTHMMMHDLLNSMPIWVIEGTAELVESFPFKNGVFECDRIHAAIKDYQKKMPPPESFSEAMTMTTKQWQQRPSAETIAGSYHAACLLIYYFSYLEGDKRGTKFLNFLEACAKDKPLWDAYEQGLARYRAQIEEFKHKPGVTILGDGRFSYPSSLTPPAPPPAPFDKDPEQAAFVHQNVLLAGKTVEQVALEAEQALQKVGLRANK